MLASIGDAVGAPAALVLPKNVPELERGGLHFPTRPPSPPLLPPLPPPSPLPPSLHAGDRFSPQKHGIACRERIGCK